MAKHGQRSSTSRNYGPAGAADDDANPTAQRDLSGSTALPGAADAATDSAEAAGPSEALRAGRSSGRTKPEYTVVEGRLDHATFQERASTSVKCTGLEVKLYMPRSEEAWAGYLTSTDVRIVFR